MLAYKGICQIPELLLLGDGVIVFIRLKINVHNDMKWTGDYQICNSKFRNKWNCSVTIRGDHQDEAVLCTEKATFDLKMADTSNSLLLVPECILFKDEGQWMN